MPMWKRALVVVLAIVATACSVNPYAPTNVPVDDCEYYYTGTLVLVNRADTLTARDAYLDDRFVGVFEYGSRLALTIRAGVHTVEWESTLTGRLVNSGQVVVPACATTTFTNYY